MAARSEVLQALVIEVEVATGMGALVNLAKAVTLVCAYVSQLDRLVQRKLVVLLHDRRL